MTTSRIVVVDDDRLTTKVLHHVLTDAGYEPVIAGTGAEALQVASSRDVQLMVLDINLPDMNGFELLSTLRSRRFARPVLCLSALTSLDAKLNAFRLGADDYLAKPFEPLELVARIEVVLRRYQRSDQHAVGRVIQVADARLDLGTLRYHSDIVAGALLAPTEVRVLETLMRNAHTVVSREQLIERVWGREYFGEDNRVDVYIRRLRRKIERDPGAPQYLHTLRGHGFVFRPQTAGEADS